MGIEASNSINSLHSSTNYDAVQPENTSSLAATDSIFSEREEFMSGLKADTGLIDKMKTFFENLETREYDPRNSMFPEYNNYI